jgi:hypothetical protein
MINAAHQSAVAPSPDCKACGVPMVPVGKLPATPIKTALKVFRCPNCNEIKTEPLNGDAATANGTRSHLNFHDPVRG